MTPEHDTTFQTDTALQGDSSFSAEIEWQPDGIANCVLIAFRGEIVVSGLPSIFDALRPDLPGDELNVISDYGAASLYANLNDLAAAYRHFHRNGIRIFRSVVVDSDRGRPLFQNFSRAVAENAGLQVEFTNVPDRAEAFATMRAMLRRAPPVAMGPAMDDIAGSGHPDRLFGLGLDTVSAAIDIEFEPGGLANSFMFHVTGRYDAADATKVIASLGPTVAAGTLNIICDERRAVAAIEPGSLDIIYDKLLDLGIRRYNLIIVSVDPARGEKLRQAQEVARSRGIDARFALTQFAERAVVGMRRLLAGPSPPDM